MSALNELVALAQRLGATPEEVREAVGYVPATLPLDEPHPAPRPGMRRLVYVDLPVAVLRRTALVVRDSADLEAQVAARRAAELAAFPQAEPVRLPAPKGQKGKGPVASHPMGPGWDRP